MKIVFKTILKYYLKYLTRLVLFLRDPVIIAVAGSTNKTFVKDEIKRALKERGLDVASNSKSFNTEIGLPLAILNLPSGYHLYRNWPPIIMKSLAVIFKKNFPKYLVLEMGVSEPGDMKYLLSIIKPDVAIITDITQRYLESFNNMDDLAEEYEYLAKNVKKEGILILNYDNKKIREIDKIADVKKVFFGIDKNAEWNAEEEGESKGIRKIIISNKEKTRECFTNRRGQHHLYSMLVGAVMRDYAEKKKI